MTDIVARAYALNQEDICTQPWVAQRLLIELAADVERLRSESSSVHAKAVEECAAAVRLSAWAPLPPPTEGEVEKAALAIAVSSVCGLQRDGNRLLCCDPAGQPPVSREHCDCLTSARAALTAFLNGNG